jgi:LytS/YehU family sensor histidine kinase
MLFRLAHRFPWNRSGLVRTIVAHVVAILVCAVVYYAVNTTLWWGYGALAQDSGIGMDSFWAQLKYQVAYRVRSFYLPMLTVLAVSHAVHLSRRSKQRELRTIRLESQLTQAQLQNLKMQLHPHFLFNTLHAISALIKEDPDRAEEMIARLSELLRASLSTASDQRVRLVDEIEILEIYLDIQKTRFGDRLRVTIELDPETLETKVPSLLLQPLVENAIKHGITNLEGPGCIHIHSESEGSRLVLEVRNDGPPMPASGIDELRLGTGLGITLERLEHLYGSDFRFSLANAPEAGVTVRVELPSQCP